MNNKKGNIMGFLWNFHMNSKRIQLRNEEVKTMNTRIETEKFKGLPPVDYVVNVTRSFAITFLPRT